jgi:hypothetical protein
MNRGGRPAMTIREIRTGLRDEADGLHWSWGRCWCEHVHQDQATGLPVVLPPWDAARQAGAAA